MSEFGSWIRGSGLLRGQVAVVAGGGMGIGESTVRLLSMAGAAVAVVDYDADRARAVAQSITDQEAPAVAIVADLRDEAACEHAVEAAVDRFGGVDILANVAGGMSKHATWKPLKEWDTQTWDGIVHLNLRYVFWLTRAVIPVMEGRGGGAIVNVTSIAGSFGCPDQAPYGAAKAGLINLTKTLAVEAGPAGIRVNAVSPGVTLTESAQAAMKAETREVLTDLTPLRRLGRPDDIARAILFFASPLADGVTGQTLLVDGGASVIFPYHAIHG